MASFLFHIIKSSLSGSTRTFSDLIPEISYQRKICLNVFDVAQFRQAYASKHHLATISGGNMKRVKKIGNPPSLKSCFQLVAMKQE